MSVALISGPYFSKLVHLSVLSILSQGLEFIYLSPGPDFIKLVRVRILSNLSPGPGRDLITAIQKASPGPNFINFSVRVRVRILSIESESESRFYLFSSLGRVRILSSMSGSASGSGFSQHPRVGAAYLLVFVPFFSKCLRMRNF